MSAFTQETVQRRCLYTGEGLQQARRGLGQLPAGASALPSAKSSAQQWLEARVLLGLLEYRNVHTRYPLGITAVHPEPTCITLCVESEERAAEILFSMLPTYAPDSEVWGVPGLRITRRFQTGLELRVLGQPARLRLTGLPSTVWRSAENRALEKWLAGVQMCWRASARAWSGAEREHQAMWDDEDDHFVRVQRRGAWLGSDLLRRLGLLHTVANTFVVDGYEGTAYDVTRLILRSSHVPNQGPGPRHIVSALLDPVFGLPLRLKRFRGDTDESYASDQDFVLGDPAKTAVLELRTTRERPPSRLPTDLWQSILRRLPSEGFETTLTPSTLAGACGLEAEK
ncbi:hypothetical protein [Streptomyces ureilyticus]|uniref:Uncharacterized protein n=1 Tax=Streptomyces ureilyticus TaxID=1775131 RepID=A0ABX0DT69_9ACTN|nr:hypothetical protein [Streptomyces ureilyticus]NGO45101.1 hypothetical protein [Streptomyces ureilyticus]